MSESSIAIAAGAALSGVLDHIDLDSHYNLKPDSPPGSPFLVGVILLTQTSGHRSDLNIETILTEII